MPTKLDWHGRHLFVDESLKGDVPGLLIFLNRCKIYERAIGKCAGRGSTALVFDRRLPKEDIVRSYQRYVSASGFSYRMVTKRASKFKTWSQYLNSRPPTQTPVTVLFCSPEVPLRIFLKLANNRTIKKLDQAIAEGLPHVVKVPWSDESVCMFGDSVWKLDSFENTLELADLRLLILDRIDRERRKFELLRTRYAGDAGRKVEPVRQPISEGVRIYVWRRDQGRCVYCGSQERLEFDHIIPVSKGGGSTDRNVQLLCERCNRSKKDRI